MGFNGEDGPVTTKSVLSVTRDAFMSVSASGAQELSLLDQTPIPLSSIDAIIIETFAIPRTLESGVLSIRCRAPDLGADEVLAALSGLIDRGVVGSERLDRGSSVSVSGLGMFGCPRLSLEDALRGDSCDVAFVGMPYELGITGRDGTRRGPSYLRRCSRVAFDYVEKAGVPDGWWDTLKGRRVLEAVRFADIGNVSCRDTARNGIAFDNLYKVVDMLLSAGRLPVVIGGDHSISYATINAAVARFPRLGVIHLDAHPDLGRAPGTCRWRQNLTHGNFMSWLEPAPEIQLVLQLGVRHLLSEPPYVSEKVMSHPGRGWLSRIEEIASSLPKDHPYFLTCDVDCLDPNVISQTGTPVPGGLSYEDVRTAFQTFAKEVNIIGVDIVELTAPRVDENVQEGTIISYLLFELLAAIFDRRRCREF
ncbi:arginase family protein [Pseudomonas guariconensis]|uniref:arginase family protein n=1 Tax=Pseudomonas guariconensis TaxID=1288410 RepID=UPI0038729160